MSALHCTTCKFTLECSAAEATAYQSAMPMHCGAPMIWRVETILTPVPAVHNLPSLPTNPKRKKK